MLDTQNISLIKIKIKNPKTHAKIQVYMEFKSSDIFCNILTCEFSKVEYSFPRSKIQWVGHLVRGRIVSFLFRCFNIN